MKRFLTALAVALVAIFAGTGCNDYGNTFQNNTGAQITALSPSNITAGSASFTLTITGFGFVPQTFITWNGMKLATSDITDSAGDVLQVTAVIPASLVAQPGKGAVLTHNPFSGAGNNGLSNPLNFIINPVVPPNPVPLLQMISPTNIAAGSPTFSLTLTGESFVTSTDPTQATAVFWNAGGTPTMLAITFATPTQIIATVPASLVASANTVSVSALNPPNSSGTPPAGGGGTSSPLAFIINAAAQAGITKSQAAAEETPAMSADGRFVTYTAMEGQHSAVFFRDTCQGATAACQAATSLVSVASDGSPANDDSHTPAMSSDGRYVAFSSAATNLVATTGATSSAAASSAAAGRQIYLRDTCTGAPAGCTPSTELISTDSAGQLAGLESILPSVSASGRFVAFVAVARSQSTTGTTTATPPQPAAAPAAASAAASTTNANSGYRQIFVRDTCLATANCTAKTSRISLQPGDGTETAPAAGAAPPAQLPR